MPIEEHGEVEARASDISLQGKSFERNSLVKESIKGRIPWFLKIPAKIVLSRLPFSMRNWQALNIFRAGGMDSPEYAYSIFSKHVQRCGLSTLDGATVLELGPGNSLLSALYARSLGAERTWLIDADRLASDGTSLFREAQEDLSRRGLLVPDIAETATVESVLKGLNALYGTSGLQSLHAVPDGAIDFLFSNAVLEHIRLAEFVDTIREIRRVVKSDGVVSHTIDFRDHLQCALNNLRFSERLWESPFMASSGFYTNRITWPAMEKIFKDSDFTVALHECYRWPGGLPTAQKKMSSPFREMASEDLMVYLVHVVLRPTS